VHSQLVTCCAFAFHTTGARRTFHQAAARRYRGALSAHGISATSLLFVPRLAPWLKRRIVLIEVFRRQFEAIGNRGLSIRIVV
jgi:hypothetical protein